MSLRAILASVTILLTLIAVLASGALVSLTTILRRTTVNSAASVESVRLVEEAEVDLLLHGRATDPLIRRDIEGDLREKLSATRRFLSTEEESAALRRAEADVDRYLTAPPHTLDGAERAARQEAAYAALEHLIDINVAQANEAQAEALRWDDIGTGIGIGSGVLLLVVCGALLIWLRMRAFQPIFGLAGVMRRFGRGDLDARADEHGPRELREMCMRFNEMASAIAAQRRAQMAFLGGVAHDLRNPLSVLQMSVSLLEQECTTTTAGPRATTERIRRQLARMERMLGDFLDVTKIEAGELELQLGVHDARELVKGVLELFEGATQGHELKSQVPAAPVLLQCDQLRIEQVITNLISNAIKYSPAATPVEIVLEPTEGAIEICVIDRGVGMSQRDVERVFEPFRRVGLSKESVPGVGLGLFVVRKIVAAHGGSIEVDSKPGAGSTFRVRLPRDPGLRPYRALGGEGTTPLGGLEPVSA